jgi:beta-glucosidase
MSVSEMMNFGYCETEKECAYHALKAGLDVELGASCYIKNLETLVEEGRLAVSEIDEAVLRVLLKKFHLGLFDKPYEPFKRDKNVVFCDDHIALSEKMALESVVLLENNGVLPLRRDIKVALVGNYATSISHYGCWQHSTRYKEVVTLQDGLEQQGFTLTGVSDTFSIVEAEKTAYHADVVILAFGETSEESGEAFSKHNLHVKKEVIDCFNYLKSRGKKVVSLVFSGRPLIINEFKQSDALAFCWHLGQRAGTAVAKLLSGEMNFSGKLTMTIPRTEGQLPMYYARKRAGRPFEPERLDWRFQAKYCDGENFPQYAFGYGLSYSTFNYGEVELTSNIMKRKAKIEASVQLTNESNFDGTEIVQLYIRDEFSEVVRPQRELKGFRRVFLKAGESKRIVFEITEDMLEYYHIDGELCADTGSFYVYIGKDCNTENKAKFILE